MWATPRFSEFTGPFKVGTIDVEIPVSDLDAPSSSGVSQVEIKTVHYRVFYPCEPGPIDKHTNWLPHPQHLYLGAYSRFLGIGSTVASYLSYIPNPLSWIKIPAYENAPITKPNTPTKQWPVMIFSHGLGGTRNAYSFLAGSIASYGMVVVAPEHRDGSAPISFVRHISEEAAIDKPTAEILEDTVDYIHLSHVSSHPVETGRNNQLKIRLRELGLIFDSLLKINQGISIRNLAPSHFPLHSLKSMMDVETPGKITFTGHSFGAATVVQFVKSVFYAPQAFQAPSDNENLFEPSASSTIVKQINAQTPIILLDVWCLPLRAKTTRWLWNLPFPSYSDNSYTGGDTLLAIESHAFYKWEDHLKTTKQLLSPDPALSTRHSYLKSNNSPWSVPYFYYAENSAHISHSDFGLLFPWVTKKILGCKEPERLMGLQVRAILQFLREQKVPIAPTSALYTDSEKIKKNEGDEIFNDDKLILGSEKKVRGWVRINLNLDESV
ncbi:hypothetical protein Golomagni_04696 [Golovinomyces magnicellulatus]|nr:hypothetical protein Golomagni_04696 [Golovinomyces magnicellulatus]